VRFSSRLSTVEKSDGETFDKKKASSHEGKKEGEGLGAVVEGKKEDCANSRKGSSERKRGQGKRMERAWPSRVKKKGKGKGD